MCVWRPGNQAQRSHLAYPRRSHRTGGHTGAWVAGTHRRRAPCSQSQLRGQVCSRVHSQALHTCVRIPTLPAPAWANVMELLSTPFHARSAAELDNRFVTLGCNFPVWEALGRCCPERLARAWEGGVPASPGSHLPPGGPGEPRQVGSAAEDTGQPSPPESAPRAGWHQPPSLLHGLVWVQHPEQPPPWPRQPSDIDVPPRPTRSLAPHSGTRASILRMGSGGSARCTGGWPRTQAAGTEDQDPVS